MRLTRRDIATFILLSLFTCGIYSIYWYVVSTDEIQASMPYQNDEIPSGGVCFLLNIVTCGIYSIYWCYKQSQRISSIRQAVGLPPKDDSTVYLLLAIFGFAIVVYALMQNEFNSIVAAYLNGNNQNNNGGYNNSNYGG